MVGFELVEMLFASDPWVLGSQVYTTTCDPKVSEIFKKKRIYT